MKKQTPVVASLCLVFALAVVPAHAQEGGVQVRVPFNFAVAGRTFPAGQYTMIANSHQVKIQNARGNMVAMVLANEISGRSSGANRIVFRCYRERCFLSEIWSSTIQNGRQLLISQTELALAKEEPGKYFAVLGEKPRR